MKLNFRLIKSRQSLSAAVCDSFCNVCVENHKINFQVRSSRDSTPAAIKVGQKGKQRVKVKS